MLFLLQLARVSPFYIGGEYSGTFWEPHWVHIVGYSKLVQLDVLMNAVTQFAVHANHSAKTKCKGLVKKSGLVAPHGEQRITIKALVCRGRHLTYLLVIKQVP